MFAFLRFARLAEARRKLRSETRIAIFAALAFIPFSSSLAADLLVFAAASTKEALDEVIKPFEKKTGHSVRVSYAASNALAHQIVNGAPAHLFLSADDATMDALAAKQLIAPDTRRVLLATDLVVIEPASNPGVETTRLAEVTARYPFAELLRNGRLAVANPDSVPAGKYTKAALTSLGLWSVVESKLARAENVRAALAFVARGEAPLGIVYRTDALIEPKVRTVAVFPKSSHPPIGYPVAILKAGNNAAARALLAHLSSDDAKKIFESFGFNALLNRR
jgi:molybdate transport system substrate-binding protein